MTTPPTIEPVEEPPALSGQPPPERPPGFIPYPNREQWWKRNPGATAAILIALAAGGSEVGQAVWSVWVGSERAERQRLITEGDRAEAKARANSDTKLLKIIKANGKATAANGAAIGSMATHALESARHTRLLLRSIVPQNSPALEMPDPLRDAETALRKLKSPN